MQLNVLLERLSIVLWGGTHNKGGFVMMQSMTLTVIVVCWWRRRRDSAPTHSTARCVWRTINTRTSTSIGYTTPTRRICTHISSATMVTRGEDISSMYVWYRAYYKDLELKGDNVLSNTDMNPWRSLCVLENVYIHTCNWKFCYALFWKGIQVSKPSHNSSNSRKHWFANPQIEIQENVTRSV